MLFKEHTEFFIQLFTQIELWISSKPRDVISSLKGIHHVDENIVDPDQLVSSEASWSGSTLFSEECRDFLFLKSY